MGLKSNLSNSFLDNALVTKFIKHLTIKGKRATIHTMMLKIFKYIKTQNLGISPLQLIVQAIENVKPLIEVKTVKRRHISTQIPVEITKARQETLAIRWIILSTKQRNEKTFWLKLAHELIDCFNNKGNAIKKRQEMHKLAVLQKRFLHFYK